MNSEKWIEKSDKYIMKTYGRYPIVPVRGAGSRIWDADGKDYLDGSSVGIASQIGYGDPDVAVCGQLADGSCYTAVWRNDGSLFTPLTNGLGALEQQAVNPGWKAVIGDLRVRLERGSSMSDALAMHPEYFDKVYQSMVAAGESRCTRTID